MAIFPTFLFRQYRPGKFLLRYYRTKNAFLGYKNIKFKKSKTWHFSKGVNPWFWPKNGHFSNFFFLRQYKPGKFLLRYSRTKNAFLGYKKKKFKKSKNWHFSKALTHGFNPKMVIFSPFFFRQDRPGKGLLRYSRTKNPLLSYKTKKFKKSKNWHYSKGVNPWFWSKNGHFSTLFLLVNIGQENVFCDI